MRGRFREADDCGGDPREQPGAAAYFGVTLPPAFGPASVQQPKLRRQRVEGGPEKLTIERRVGLFAAKTRVDRAAVKERVIIGEAQCVDARPRARGRTVIGAQFADYRLDRHRRDIWPVIALSQKMPAPFDHYSFGKTARMDEHPAAMLAEAHAVEHRVEEAREAFERGQAKARARLGEQVQDAVQDLGHRPRAHPDIGQRRQGARDELEIGDVDEREMKVLERQAPGNRDGIAQALGESDAVRVLAAAPQFHRRAGIADDRAHHVEPDARKGRRRDAALDRANVHRLRHLAEHRAGERGEAADPRQNEDARRFRRGIEAVDAEDKIGAVGEIEIVGLRRDARLDHSIAVGAIVLKRSRGIDDEIGPEAV